VTFGWCDELPSLFFAFLEILFVNELEMNVLTLTSSKEGILDAKDKTRIFYDMNMTFRRDTKGLSVSRIRVILKHNIRTSFCGT
jgi:hypothetical protein